MTNQAIPTIHEIQQTVCRAYRVRLLDVLSQRREREATRARQVAMWICRHTTLCSLPEIGRAFGKRDHTTVLHAIRRIDGLMAEDAGLASGVWQLVDIVSSGNSVEIRRARMGLVA